MACFCCQSHWIKFSKMLEKYISVSVGLFWKFTQEPMNVGDSVEWAGGGAVQQHVSSVAMAGTPDSSFFILECELPRVTPQGTPRSLTVNWNWLTGHIYGKFSALSEYKSQFPNI